MTNMRVDFREEANPQLCIGVILFGDLGGSYLWRLARC